LPGSHYVSRASFKSDTTTTKEEEDRRNHEGMLSAQCDEGRRALEVGHCSMLPGDKSEPVACYLAFLKQYAYKSFLLLLYWNTVHFTSRVPYAIRMVLGTKSD
jgi:hypothetical protein